MVAWLSEYLLLISRRPHHAEMYELVVDLGQLVYDDGEQLRRQAEERGRPGGHDIIAHLTNASLDGRPCFRDWQLVRREHRRHQDAIGRPNG